jgi:hypothetical protein
MEADELKWAEKNCRKGADDAPAAVREDEVAAKAIQNRFRSHKAKQELQESKGAALSLQSNFRGYKSRQAMKQKASAAEKEKQEDETKIAKLQAMHRGKIARQEMKKDSDAIAKIQARQRGKMSRRQGTTVGEEAEEEDQTAADLVEALDDADAEVAAADAELAELLESEGAEDSALLIQAKMRGRAARKEQKEMEEAASRIQGHFRYHQSFRAPTRCHRRVHLLDNLPHIGSYALEF